MNIKDIPLSEIPDCFLREATTQLHNFSTVLIRMFIDRKGENQAEVIGSGTFAKIEGKFGIVTARHVISKLENEDDLGLIIQPQEHRFTIPVNYLRMIYIEATGMSPYEIDEIKLPDLAYICLPESKVGTIKAAKSFYDLEKDRAHILKTPPKYKDGVWFVCGTPDIWNINEKSEIFPDLKGIHGLCGATGVEKDYNLRGFDYLETRAEYQTENDVPESFGGTSGGGLWQVTFGVDENGMYKPKDYNLVGIPIYQTPLENNIRYIGSHGPMSIYKQLYEKVLGELNL